MEQSTRPFQYLECRTDLPEDLRQWILAKLDGIHELLQGESDEPRIKANQGVVLHGNALPDRLPRRHKEHKRASANNAIQGTRRQDDTGSKELNEYKKRG